MQNQLQERNHQSVRYVGRYTRQPTYSEFARCYITNSAWVILQWHDTKAGEIPKSHHLMLICRWMFVCGGRHSNIINTLRLFPNTHHNAHITHCPIPQTNIYRSYNAMFITYKVCTFNRVLLENYVEFKIIFKILNTALFRSSILVIIFIINTHN
jgi:hypothetical protein